MRLHEEVAQELPLRRKHTDQIMDASGYNVFISAVAVAVAPRRRPGRPGWRLLFRRCHCLDDDGVQAVPVRCAQSRCRQQAGGPGSGAGLAAASGEQGRQQQGADRRMVGIAVLHRKPV